MIVPKLNLSLEDEAVLMEQAGGNRDRLRKAGNR